MLLGDDVNNLIEQGLSEEERKQSRVGKDEGESISNLLENKVEHNLVDINSTLKSISDKLDTLNLFN